MASGCDVYTAQFVLDVVSLFVFVWAYFAVSNAAAAAAAARSLVASVQRNMLPGAFVLQLFVLTLLLVAERVAYTLHSVYVKACLHASTAAGCAVVYLVWLHLYALAPPPRLSLSVRDVNDDRTASGSTGGGGVAVDDYGGAVAVATAPARVLLLLRLCSLWVSAWQLRRGYAAYHTPYTLTARTDVWHWAAHTLYRAVPFLLELRLLLDWSFSTTALKLQHWMLIEDVHHVLYVRYVDMHDLAHTSRRHGHTFPRCVKAYQGVLGFCGALLVVFCPLFTYSSLSPQVRGNDVVAWRSALSLAPHGGGAPLYSGVASIHDVQSLHKQTQQQQAWWLSRVVDTSTYNKATRLSPSSSSSSAAAAAAEERAWRAALAAVTQHADASVSSALQLLLLPVCSAVSWQMTAPAWHALRARVADAVTQQQANATHGTNGATTSTRPDDAATTRLRDAAVYVLQTHEVTRAVSAARALATLRVVRRYRVPPSSLLQLHKALTQLHDDVNKDNKTTAASWQVQLPHFWPTFVLNTPADVQFPLQDTPQQQQQQAQRDDDDDKEWVADGVDCVLQLHREGGRGDVYWCMRCDSTATTATTRAAEDNATHRSSSSSSSSNDESSRRWPLPPYMAVSSPDVLVTISTLSFLPNLGIVALYTTFVFALSRLVRGVVAGEAFHVYLTQIADPEPLAELLRFLYVARSSASNGHVEDALLEQHLFAMLLDLLRSPDTLARRSGWRVDDYGVRGYLRRRLRTRWRRPFDIQQQQQQLDDEGTAQHLL